MGLKQEFIYNATIISWVDGDTCDLSIDLGFRLLLGLRVRLARVNAPEFKGETKNEALKTKAFVEDNCKPGTKVLVKTYKDRQEKYGRYLAEIWFNFNNEFVCLNDLLLEKGLARPYE